MTVARRRGAAGAADRLFARLVKARDGWTCRRCGARFRPGDARLHCAHLISRHFSATRCEPDNAVALCASCHQRVDTHADEMMTLIAATIGIDRYRELKDLALGNRGRWDWDATLARLRAWRDERSDV